jgi:hypothetical protein
MPETRSSPYAHEIKPVIEKADLGVLLAEPIEMALHPAQKVVGA